MFGKVVSIYRENGGHRGKKIDLQDMFRSNQKPARFGEPTALSGSQLRPATIVI